MLLTLGTYRVIKTFLSTLQFCNNDTDVQSSVLLLLKANSNCADAKTKLEHLCKDLSPELAHFDWRKEVELREILIEYSALRSEHFEKVCVINSSIYQEIFFQERVAFDQTLSPF